MPVGTATIGMEIVEQVPTVSTVYVPMGDTALIRGVAAAVKQLSPKVRVVGVQAERAPSYYLSWKQGKAVPTDTCDTCADGLATRTPEQQNVKVIRELVDDVVLVSEESDACRRSSGSTRKRACLPNRRGQRRPQPSSRMRRNESGCGRSCGHWRKYLRMMLGAASGVV